MNKAGRATKPITLRQLIKLLKLTWSKWQTDNASRLAAALSYYATFSLAPILIIFIAILSPIFGAETAQTQVVAQLRKLVGEDGASIVQIMMHDAQQSDSDWATAVSLVFLVWGATRMFTQLQDALNTIWQVRPKPGRALIGFLRDRILSFALIIGFGCLLLTALGISTGLASLSQLVDHSNRRILLEHLNALVSFGVITILFAIIYKILPDVWIQWSDVWVGAIMSSLLFAIGKSMLGLYLGHSSLQSTYGAAGSLIALLLWVNYSAQIFFLGAELTQVYAEKYGSDILPAPYAIATD